MRSGGIELEFLGGIDLEIGLISSPNRIGGKISVTEIINDLPKEVLANANSHYK